MKIYLLIIYFLFSATKNLSNSKKLKTNLKKIVIPTELLNHKSNYIEKGPAYYFPKKEADFSTRIKSNQPLNNHRGTLIVTKTISADKGIMIKEESGGPKETETITTKLLVHPQYKIV